MPTARRRKTCIPFWKASLKGSIIKDQFASNTPEDVAVMLRPLTEALAQLKQRRSNRMYFLFTMVENPHSAHGKKTRAGGSENSCLDDAAKRPKLPRTKGCPDPRVGGPAGGARRDRTDDLMLAKHALSQLSYGPFPEGKPQGQIRECAPLSPRQRRPKWWAWEDLNFRPHAYQARALTN